MDAFMAWLGQLQWEKGLSTILVAAASILCITIHETCHGLAALALGDPTAKRAGRLTLNPLKHVDLVGLVLLIAARFGWAKPVPVDARNLKNPRTGMAVISVAGPVANVLLSAAAVVCYSVCMFYALYFKAAALAWAADFFYDIFYISAGLAVFNLLPFPPLDGSKVLFSFLPEAWYWKLMRYERYGMFVLMGLLLTGVLDTPLNFLRDGLLRFLVPISEWTLELLTAIHF